MAKIIFLKSSIFDCDSDFKVCPVNMVGVMGAGLAKAFKEKYLFCESTYKHYLDWIKDSGFLIHDEIIYLATKDHWKNISNLKFIKDNLVALVSCMATLPDKNIFPDKKETGVSVSFPKLGCGCGGLKWDQVKPMMIEELSKLNDFWTIRIYE